jgi:hypothetical protein
MSHRPTDIKQNDIILIGGNDPMWINCFLQVDEVRAWGVIGSVRGPQQNEYPLRVSNEDIVGVYRKVSS